MSVERSGAAGERSASAADAANPWPGLAPFTEAESRLFHGRSEEIRTLLRLIERKPLTVLFGQSGLGKSSLLQAGVFPLLRATGYCPSYIRLDHSDGAPPPAEQVKAFIRDASARAGTWTKPGVAQPGESLWEFFHHRDDRLIDKHGDPIIPVLVIDQFEELFTLGAGVGAQRDRAVAFMTALAELVENRVSDHVVARLEKSPDDLDAFDFSRTDYRVCLSLREDFLPQLETLAEIMPALMENRMRLTRMTGTQALEAVLKPGAGLVTEEVARTIVEFVAGARGGSAERLAELTVEPPLLSVICHELNDRRHALGHAQITADLVTGNRREILNDFYERCVADLPDGMRRFVEDKLLTKSGFRDNLALETALEEPGVTQPLIDTLVTRRLLRIEDRIGAQRVELTHDVLAEVIRASRDARQQRQALEQARAHEQRELAAAARQARRQRWIIGGLTAVVVALCAAGFFGLRQRRLDLQRNSRTDVVTASRLLEEGKTTEGIAQLLRAARRDPHNPAVAPRLASLLTSRNFLLPEGAPVSHPAPVLWTDFSADGKSAGVLWQDGAHASIDLATGAVERWQLPSPPIKGSWQYATRGLLVVQCQDGVTRLLDFAGRLVREIRYEVGPGARRSFSRRLFAHREYDSRFFYHTLADQTVVVADSTTGRKLPPTAWPEGSEMGFSEKWFLLSAGVRADTREIATEAHLRDAETGDIATTLRAPFGAVRWLLSPTGRQAVAMQRESGKEGLFLRRYSLPDGAPLDPASPVAPGQEARGIFRYSWDGRHILTWNRVLEVWDADTGARVAVIPSTENSLQSTRLLRVSPDNRTLATFSTVGSLELWDLSTGNLRVPPLKHAGNVLEASFSADGLALLTIATDGLVRVWDTTSGQLLAEPTLQQRTPPIAALSPDRTQVTIGTREGALYRFRIGQGRAKSVELPRTAQSMPAPFLPGSPSRLLQLLDARARVIDAATGREVPGGFAYPEPLRARPARITQGSALFAGSQVRADFKVMAALTASGTWQAWWLGEGKVDQVVPLEESSQLGRRSTAVGAAFSASGDRVAMVNPGNIRVWNLRTGQPVGPTIDYQGGAGQNGGVNFNPDGTRVTVGVSRGAGQVWDVATGKPVFTFDDQGTRVSALFYSPDGRRLATANGSGEVQFWDSRTGEPVSPVLMHDTAIGTNGAEFSPDGNLLSFSVDGVLKIWEGATGEPIGQPISLGTAAIRSAKFSADGRRIVTASADTQVRLWDVRSGLAAAEPLVHEQEIVRAPEFSPDGRFVRTETVDNVYHLWSVPPPLPAGGKTPEWLLDLAAICAGKTLNEDGQFVNAAGAFAKIADLRRTLAALPDDAPYVEWGRWFLADRATRSVAPGFTITAAEAAKIAASKP